MEGAKVYRGMSYDEIARSGASENKPKQGQFDNLPGLRAQESGGAAGGGSHDLKSSKTEPDRANFCIYSIANHLQLQR